MRTVWNWKYTFNRDIFGSVIEMTLAALPPDYKTVLEFDQKIREMPLPPALNIFLNKNHDETSINVYLKGSYLSMIRSVTMLYIHKGYFARALLDHPGDPLLSPYATSFLAAARCASVIIQSCSRNIKRFPKLYTRFVAVCMYV